jgi:hypothetical protein
MKMTDSKETVTKEHQTKEIKDYIKDINLAKKINEIEKDEPKEEVNELPDEIAYTIPKGGNSGCDLVLDKSKNKKIVQSIYLFPSLGEYWFFDHVKGVKSKLDKSNLRSFLSGITHSSSIMEIDHHVFDFFKKSNKWIELFLKVIHKKEFRTLAKADVISMRSLMGLRHLDGETYEMRDRLWWSGNLMENEEVKINEGFLKTAKVLINELQNKGYTHRQTLDLLYDAFPKKRYTYYGETDECNRYKDAVTFFTVLGSVYSPEFATKCAQDFVKNPYANNLDTALLTRLLTINPKTGTNTDCTGFHDNSSTVETLKRKMSEHEVIHFSPDGFWNYLFVLGEAEGMVDDLKERMQLWLDTIIMSIGNGESKPDKYPKNLKIAHDIKAFEARVRNESIETKRWDEAVKNAEKYEVHDKTWMLIAPKLPTDLTLEAKQQNNCVAGYRNQMARGDCTIMFLRKTARPSISECTIEIKDNRLLQVKARFNQQATDEQKAGLANLLKKLKEEKGINIEYSTSRWY